MIALLLIGAFVWALAIRNPGPAVLGLGAIITIEIVLVLVHMVLERRRLRRLRANWPYARWFR